MAALFTCERERLPSVMMHFQSLPPFWWTCGMENTEISVKRESYFSTWLNWFRRRFLCAIDPPNGFAPPRCAKVHNKYLFHSSHVKILHSRILDCTLKCLKSLKQKSESGSSPKAGGLLSLRLCMSLFPASNQFLSLSVSSSISHSFFCCCWW